MPYDLLIKNVRVVRPNASSVEDADIAITGEKFAQIGRTFPPRKRRRSTTAKAGSRFRAWSTPTCTPASTRRSKKTR